jgi:hypothetical protein
LTEPSDYMMEVDIKGVSNPQNVAEFALDIQRHFLAEEVQFQAKPDCFKFQKDINLRMRTVLVNWVI